jgi:hypothetical protein
VPDEEQLSFASILPKVTQEEVHQTIVIHFLDQQAVDQFAKAIGQSIYPKTRRLWYPA